MRPFVIFCLTHLNLMTLRWTLPILVSAVKNCWNIAKKFFLFFSILFIFLFIFLFIYLYFGWNFFLIISRLLFVSLPAGNIYVTNIKSVVVTSQEQVALLLEQAARNRAVAATHCNERSSRSHSVFRLHITGHNTITDQTHKSEPCGGKGTIVKVVNTIVKNNEIYTLLFLRFSAIKHAYILVILLTFENAVLVLTRMGCF